MEREVKNLRRKMGIQDESKGEGENMEKEVR